MKGFLLYNTREFKIKPRLPNYKPIVNCKIYFNGVEFSLMTRNISHSNLICTLFECVLDIIHRIFFIGTL